MPRKRLKQKWRLSDTGDQDGVIVLITGSNAGIGFEMAMEFAGKGAEVILGCRSLQRAEVRKNAFLDDTRKAVSISSNSTLQTSKA